MKSVQKSLGGGGSRLASGREQGAGEIHGGLEEKLGADTFKAKQNSRKELSGRSGRGGRISPNGDPHLSDLQPHEGVLICRRYELKKSPEAPSDHNDEAAQRRMCRKL